MKCFDVTGRAKAKLLNISYEHYKELEKDFFREDEEKKTKAYLEMAILMNEAKERIEKKKGKENV